MTGQHAQPPDGCRLQQTRGMPPPLMAFELVERSAAQFAERAKHLEGSDELFTSFASKNFTNERKKSQG